MEYEFEELYFQKPVVINVRNDMESRNAEIRHFGAARVPGCRLIKSKG